MKNVIIFIFAFLTLCGLPANALKVGVTAGPHADIVRKVREIGSQQGLDIEVIEFNDFVIPNEALANSELDINSYQHEPFLQSQMDSRGYKLKAIAKTVVMPLGLYSSRLKSVSDLPEGARIAMPNDPSNGGRALKLLARAGVIKVKECLNPSVLDITSNPKKLSFIEIEAPLLPQAIRDVDAALINTDWVLIAGLDSDSALIHEDKDCPYVNVLVVRSGDETREDIQEFVRIYQSAPVGEFIKTAFRGAVIPAW